jgi:hypothetical protein
MDEFYNVNNGQGSDNKGVIQTQQYNINNNYNTIQPKQEDNINNQYQSHYSNMHPEAKNINYDPSYDNYQPEQMSEKYPIIQQEQPNNYQPNNYQSNNYEPNNYHSNNYQPNNYPLTNYQPNNYQSANNRPNYSPNIYQPEQNLKPEQYYNNEINQTNYNPNYQNYPDTKRNTPSNQRLINLGNTIMK